MRPLTEALFVSLDGVVEAPERWAMPFWGPDQRANATEQLASYDAFLFGRVTYEKFAAAWGAITGDPYYDAVKRLPKFVASTTLATTTWNATLLTGDTVAAVRALKEQPGKGLVKYGFSTLDRTLIPHQLVDRFQITVFPVIVGPGRRLFEGIDPADLPLALTATKPLGNGLVQLTYERQ